MPTINFQRTYLLGDEYDAINARAILLLGKYMGYPGLFSFTDRDRSVTFSSERLIPAADTNRPRVMLLFSNPHPYSVHQGMFLSPNTKGQENLFWPVMEDAGWMTFKGEHLDPKQLADICLKGEYQGPFELIFFCYYAFPTDFPEDIGRIFGKEFFIKVIEPEALAEFRNTIQEASVKAVVTFNKGIFNLISNANIDQYINRLMDGEIIQSQIDGVDREVPLFLTFPTGWRYNSQYRQFRKASLEGIKNAICSRLNVPVSTLYN